MRWIESPCRTPRELTASADGRAEVADWLKMLENETAHAQAPARNYDFGWMWEELGLTDLRR